MLVSASSAFAPLRTTSCAVDVAASDDDDVAAGAGAGAAAGVFAGGFAGVFAGVEPSGSPPELSVVFAFFRGGGGGGRR